MKMPSTRIISLFLVLTAAAAAAATGDPTPTLWPERFHALLYMNLTDARLQITDLWYDWPRGRNLNLIQKQLGERLYDVEWDNGTSYYFTAGPDGSCRALRFEVGILRPDWLVGSTYLGRRHTDGFLCDVWTKVDFIWYYEDVHTHRPVRWDFYDGISSHVMTFEVGATLEDSEWQAPSYCFTDNTSEGGGMNASDLQDHRLRKLVSLSAE